MFDPLTITLACLYATVSMLPSLTLFSMIFSGKRVLEQRCEIFDEANREFETYANRDDVKSVLKSVEERKVLSEDEEKKYRKFKKLRTLKVDAESDAQQAEQQVLISSDRGGNLSSRVVPLRFSEYNWKGKDGKERLDLEKQHKHEAKHHSTYQKFQNVLGDPSQRANESREDLSARIDEAAALATEGEQNCEAHAKRLRIVCETGGWAVVKQLEQPEFCDTPQEAKEFAAALKVVSTVNNANGVTKFGRGRGSYSGGRGRGSYSSYGNRGGFNNFGGRGIYNGHNNYNNIGGGTGAGSGGGNFGSKDMTKVKCYSCQTFGHYASSPQCPNFKG